MASNSKVKVEEIEEVRRGFDFNLYRSLPWFDSISLRVRSRPGSRSRQQLGRRGRAGADRPVLSTCWPSFEARDSVAGRPE